MKVHNNNVPVRYLQAKDTRRQWQMPRRGGERGIAYRQRSEHRLLIEEMAQNMRLTSNTPSRSPDFPQNVAQILNTPTPPPDFSKTVAPTLDTPTYPSLSLQTLAPIILPFARLLLQLSGAPSYSIGASSSLLAGANPGFATSQAIPLYDMAVMPPQNIPSTTPEATAKVIAKRPRRNVADSQKHCQPEPLLDLALDMAQELNTVSHVGPVIKNDGAIDAIVGQHLTKLTLRMTENGQQRKCTKYITKDDDSGQIEIWVPTESEGGHEWRPLSEATESKLRKILSDGQDLSTKEMRDLWEEWNGASNTESSQVAGSKTRVKRDYNYLKFFIDLFSPAKQDVTRKAHCQKQPRINEIMDIYESLPQNLGGDENPITTEYGSQVELWRQWNPAADQTPLIIEHDRGHDRIERKKLGDSITHITYKAHDWPKPCETYFFQDGEKMKVAIPLARPQKTTDCSRRRELGECVPVRTTFILKAVPPNIASIVVKMRDNLHAVTPNEVQKYRRALELLNDLW